MWKCDDFGWNALFCGGHGMQPSPTPWTTGKRHLTAQTEAGLLLRNGHLCSATATATAMHSPLPAPRPQSYPIPIWPESSVAYGFVYRSSISVYAALTSDLADHCCLDCTWYHTTCLLVPSRFRRLTHVLVTDSTIVATLSAAISTSFSSFNNLSWLGTAYLAATAATQPLAGRLTDIYGRRAGLLVSGLAFGVGTFLCGVATREWVFILGRAIAGAGGGAAAAVSTFVGADLVPLRKRGVIQGLNNIAMGCGTGLGGFLGGFLNDVVE